VLPGSGCCHEGTAMPCLVHRHPCGGDQLRRLRVGCLVVGTATLSDGTATPRAVPTRTWLRNAENGVSLDTTLFIATAGAVHRWVTAVGRAVPLP
jgi:hypothetical protein